MKADIIGNGYSSKYYVKEKDTLLVLGCNIPRHKVDATIVSDEEIVYVLKNNISLIDVPIVISDLAYAKLQQLNIANYFVIEDIFKTLEWHNSGHYAAQFLIKQGFKEINVWGCDSLFEDNLNSFTDDHINNKKDYATSNLLKGWKNTWNFIRSQRPDIKFNFVYHNGNN